MHILTILPTREGTVNIELHHKTQIQRKHNITHIDKSTDLEVRLNSVNGF